MTTNTHRALAALLFVLSAYLIVLTVRTRRGHDSLWRLAAALAALCGGLAVSLLQPKAGPWFYPCLAVEGGAFVGAIYLLWRFDRDRTRPRDAL